MRQRFRPGRVEEVVDLDDGWVVADISVPADDRRPPDRLPGPVVVLGSQSVLVAGWEGWPGLVRLTLVSRDRAPSSGPHDPAGRGPSTVRHLLDSTGRLQVRRLSGDVVADVPSPVSGVEVTWALVEPEAGHPRGAGAELRVSVRSAAPRARPGDVPRRWLDA